ncbi:RNase HII [Mycoplasmopsis mustelae]|uniref:Ribonuclease n=1 Tax=Mycoplasmopsis mustelae TaxID=171289 RepID=A0A4R7UFB1_9BACT|nr:ribonuclease HII [Mycoplasmopsis mustelae]TDV24374.1 RNase HII [Mycoplasmopsis mustelae]
MLDYEINNLPNKIIIGCDEVGRGCLFGPLVVACVMLPKNYINLQIKDSKLLNKQKREILYKKIINEAVEYHIEIRDVDTINQSNPKQESINGMQIAISKFKNIPDVVLTDYEKININYPQINLIKGDNIALSVATASILAKVTRDKIMFDLDNKYPLYGFKKHKGYATKQHLQAIQQYGLIDGLYRIKYKPIQQFLLKKN